MTRPSFAPTRRMVLAGGFAIATALVRPAPAQGGVRELTLADGTARFGADSAPRAIAGFDGTVPGPLLRARRGGELAVRAVNRLAEPATLHWRGIRLDNRMDGVPGLTQAAIAPGGAFDYRVACPDAGTFCYHAFPAFGAQAAQGLAGLLIVEEDTPVDVDRDVAVLIQDWPVAADPARRVATANGVASLDVPVRTHERVRLRVANASATRVAVIGFAGLAATGVAVDGQPAEPVELARAAVALVPGGRIDLVADITQPPGGAIPLTHRTGDGEVAIGRLVVEAGAPARPAPRGGRVPWLPDNPLPRRIELRGAQRADVTLAEDAAGTPFDGPPLLRVRRGRTVVLALANRSAAPWAVHLHGHSARLLDDLDDGWKPWWHDTVPVAEQRTARIAFVADNPGRWLVHAHRLMQPGAALAHWFEVT